MLYRIAWILTRCILKIFYQLKIEGGENEPIEGGAIYIANHQSHLDSIVMSASLKRHIYYMAKEELFKIPLFSLLIKIMGAFPVKRGRGGKSALKTAINLLQKGQVIGMFPEGSRSSDGKLQKFHSGTALIALKCKAPILPIGIKGTEKALPKGSKKLKMSKIKVKVGELIFLDEHYNQKIDKNLLKEVNEILEERLRELLN